jgi:GDP-L-fucose synthase
MSTILVTGGSGLVGKNLQKYLPEAIYVSSEEFNLVNERDVKAMYRTYKPTHVIHLASKVGGVAANSKDPVGFFENNILMNTNVLKYAYKYKVDRLISMLSTCVFPDTVKYPLQPHKIHNGEPHYSNFGYAYAKRMLEIQTRAYQMQYNKNWTTIIPTNVYGKYDQFNLETAHVIPALIHKCYLAKVNNTDLKVMGTGTAVREFIYAEDLAKILVWALTEYNDKEPLIASIPDQRTIQEVVELITKEMNFTGNVVFDNNQNNNGQDRKPSDVEKLLELFPIKYTYLESGIAETVKWFINNYESGNVRV